MVNAKRLLSIGAFLTAAILLVVVVAIMVAPSLTSVPDFVPGSSSGADQAGQSPTPSPPSTPTATVEMGNTTITPDETGAVTIELDASDDGYGSVRMTLSLEESGVADIQNVSRTDAVNLEVIDSGDESVTFEASGIDGGQGTVTPAQIYVDGDSVGSTTVDAEIQTLTTGDGTDIEPTVSDGDVTVEAFRPNVTAQNLSITHTDQYRIEENVTVDQATLSEGGFVVLYNHTDDGSIGDEIGNSSYLEPGEHTNVSVSPTQLIRNDREVTVRLQYDKNDNQVWDGELTDTKFAGPDQGVVTSNTTVSVQFVTHVNVTLTNVSDGLQRYRIGISTPSDEETVVSEATGHAITGSNFGIIGGGSRYQHVEVQGVDLNDRVEESAGNVTLFTVQFENGDQLERHQVDTHIFELKNDDSDAIPRDNVSTEIRCYSPFNGSVEGQPRYGEPTDPDCDGVFEDVDGDGQLTSNDIQALTYVVGTNFSEEQAEAFDFGGNGELSFADVKWLRTEVR